MLTKKQKEIYDYIVKYINDEGVSPTQKEIKEYVYIIDVLPSFRESIQPFFEDYKNYAIYIDEFHTVQTQFGLNHAGNRYTHSKIGLKAFKRCFERNENYFGLFFELCKHNKVVPMSATLDDVICNDLLPYEGLLNIIDSIKK